jgi:hypothetical protein
MRGTNNAVAASAAASAALALVVLMPPAQAATTWKVARGGSCSDTGSRAPAVPFCTIGAAVRAASAGDTVTVGAGTYREQVVVTKARLILKATTKRAVVTGLNSGGSKPARSYGFRIESTATGARVRGFTVRDVNYAGIRVDGASGVVVAHVDVGRSGAHGIELIGGSGNSVKHVHSHGNASIGIRLVDQHNSKVLSSKTNLNHNHGVSLQGGSGNRVARVRSLGNVNRPGAPRTATGIDVNKNAAGHGSTGAVIEQNTTRGNGDSGIEIYQGSSGATVRRNISYDNGDHGIDVSFARNARVISNTVVGHRTPGINVEGGSTGTTIRNNISVDNAISSTGTHGNIRVDASSTSGTTLNRDLVFNSTGSGTLIEWGGADYTRLHKFRRHVGQETHGRSAAPRFVSRRGRDLALRAGSPALDTANARVSGWRATDHDGKHPFDQRSVANTGTGSPPYADLGALERRPAR